jgi:hypothetical protein
LLPHLQASEGREQDIRERLRTLGRTLAWPNRDIREGRIPSARFLAQRTGQEQLYRFLYFGTSRFVHFNVVELLRRGWVGRGGISIRGEHFRYHWAIFALHWGFRLLFDVLRDLTKYDELSSELHLVKFQDLKEAVERLEAIGQAPIVTAEELAWPPAPR